jgi:hypothetical protein
MVLIGFAAILEDGIEKRQKRRGVTEGIREIYYHAIPDPLSNDNQAIHYPRINFRKSESFSILMLTIDNDNCYHLVGSKILV